jgi:SNF2 family DNA or RNA helicase
MLIDERTKSLVMRVRDPFTLRGLFPKSKILPLQSHNFAVHHSLDTTLMLRNIGIKAPSPIRYQYNWPGKFKPFDHQYDMAEFWTLNHRGFNLSEQGTAKTNAALWAADYLMKIGKVRKVLVLAPLSTLATVWLQDIFDTLMHRRAVVVHGSPEKRRKAMETDSDFYIFNHDGVRIKEMVRTLRARKDIDVVIVDEGDEFRNDDTEKYKGLAAMLRPDMRLWWQTGTPTPNAPTDAWAQARLVQPANVPKYFGQFKRATMMQITPFKWVPRKGSNEMAFAALQPAIRFKKADCLDLPPVLKLERQSTLTPEQAKAFEAMKEEMYLDDAKLKLLGASITAVNAADKLGKLRQILCGVIKDPESGAYLPLPHAPRVNTLLECIKGASAKVIVIVPFKGIINDLAIEIAKHYTVGVLNGDVSANRRAAIIHDFKTTPDPHVLLCHPKVMSHGLNLTEADTTIFYAPIHSNAQYQQVIERFNRSGQKLNMTLIRIAAHPLEWEIYKNTDLATDTQSSMLDLYRKALS